MDSEDQRRRPRLPFHVHVKVSVGGRVLEAASEDIGMAGVLIRGTEALAIGADCDLEIRLSSGAESRVIRARGRVARQVEGLDTDGMGIEFVDMDAGSQEILWRVIRYNTPSAPSDGPAPQDA
jgi:c-di-GMP-binding flagellar brake protein YcgR